MTNFSITQELLRFTRGSLNNSDEQGLSELEVCRVCFLNPAPEGILNNPSGTLKCLTNPTCSVCNNTNK